MGWMAVCVTTNLAADVLKEIVQTWEAYRHLFFDRFIQVHRTTENHSEHWMACNVNAVLHLLVAHQRWHAKSRSTFIWTSSGNIYRKKKKKKGNQMKQHWHESRQKGVLKGLRVGVWEHLARFCSGQTAVTTDTDVRSRSFSVWAVVWWFRTDVCKRSCREVTRLIFPSAERQQGFTVVSWCVALHRDGKHREERLRTAENSLDACPTCVSWTCRVLLLLSSKTDIVTRLQKCACHIYMVQYTFAFLHQTF